VRQAKENGIKPIDLVCVNLYPFEETIARPGVTLEEAIEKIDIGGPSMLRSAAKNYASVTVVSDPADYARILDEMQTHKGDTTLKTRENLAVKVFMRTSNYDNAITNYLGHQSAESTKGIFLHLRSPVSGIALRGQSPPGSQPVRQLRGYFPPASGQGAFLYERAGH